jgi:agmatine deiminase
MAEIPTDALPADLGYRMPAEWQRHQATWFSWPHNPDTWPGGPEAAERALAVAVAALSRHEPVRINVLDNEHAVHVRGLLGNAAPGSIHFHALPTNDAWCRDHGAIFVTRPSELGDPLLALDFQYNAWGGKYPPFDLDNAMPGRMARVLGVPCRSVDMVLEGGSIDVNGAGMLLTTEQCLLHPNRNPRLDRQEIEARLRGWLGIETIIWLGDGIVGDDTDGHVDDITRFVAQDTVVTVVEPDPADPNHQPLADNLARLRSVRLADGRPLRVIELPMPAPVVSVQGERLPASYANFLIANGVVLMPAFGDPRDVEAQAILTKCFPGREVVALDCRDIVPGLGTLHCLSQQVPAVA